MIADSSMQTMQALYIIVSSLFLLMLLCPSNEVCRAMIIPWRR